MVVSLLPAAGLDYCWTAERSRCCRLANDSLSPAPCTLDRQWEFDLNWVPPGACTLRTVDARRSRLFLPGSESDAPNLSPSFQSLQTVFCRRSVYRGPELPFYNVIRIAEIMKAR